MTVQRSQASVKRGQNAAYTVQVSTQNGSAAGVSVALTAQPSSQKPAFTGGCAKEDGTAACTVGTVSAKSPASLQAQIPVGSATSVQLTATASIVTSAKWMPPSAAVTVAVAVPSASASRSPASSSPATAAGAIPGTTLPLGPVPELNNVSSSLIDAGSASNLFPRISPSATPSPAPGLHAQAAKRNERPVPVSSVIGFGQPVLTGQVAGLIALALALLLTGTRLSLRRRPGSGQHDS